MRSHHKIYRARKPKGFTVPKAPPWIRFFPSDWLAGTRGLSAVETGIYITLIASMYERGEPVPDDSRRLSRLCGASNATFKRAVDVLIEEEKIVLMDGGLWNEKVQKELKLADKKSTVARQNVNSRWSKKDNKNNGRDDTGVIRPLYEIDTIKKDQLQNQNQNQKDISDSNESSSVPGKAVTVTKKVRHEYSEEYLSFWKNWTTATGGGSKFEAFDKAWKKLAAEERRLATECAGPFMAKWRRDCPDASPLHAVRYLRNKRWEEVEGHTNGSIVSADFFGESPEDIQRRNDAIERRMLERTAQRNSERKLLQ